MQERDRPLSCTPPDDGGCELIRQGTGISDDPLPAPAIYLPRCHPLAFLDRRDTYGCLSRPIDTMGYANPTAIVVVSVLFPLIGAVAVALRFYTRHYMRAKPTLDDWLIVPAWLILCALGGLMIWGAATNSLGLPIPKPNVPGPEGFVFSYSPEQGRFLMIQYLMDLLSVWGLGLIKLSILLFYRKIFCGAGVGRTMFDYTTRFMIGLIIIWTVAFGFGFIFICKTNFSAAWGTLAGLKKNCSGLLPFLQGFGISDFITDVMILALPIPKVRISIGGVYGELKR